jgi:hypothetical protein
MPFWRKTDPATSAEAALSIPEVKVKESQQRILQLLSYGASTDTALLKSYYAGMRLADWPPISDSGLRSRRAELVALGLVEDSKARVKLPSGRHAIVWKLVD